jgi:hypothetical protein
VLFSIVESNKSENNDKQKDRSFLVGDFFLSMREHKCLIKFLYEDFFIDHNP